VIEPVFVLDALWRNGLFSVRVWSGLWEVIFVVVFQFSENAVVQMREMWYNKSMQKLTR
jgi:hypothetical protein